MHFCLWLRLKVVMGYPARMNRRTVCFILFVLLSGSVLQAEPTAKGELRVFLLLNQRTGPVMLNKIVGDIGAGPPHDMVWGRKMTLIEKVAPDTYQIVVKNVEACAFDDCVPCPDRSREATVYADQKTDVLFHWDAKYDRSAKKWTCE